MNITQKLKHVMSTLQTKTLAIRRQSFKFAMMVIAVTVPATSFAETLEAFTEPYLRIALPSSENGVIDQLLVKEGDAVTPRQVLARLDDSVLQSSLELALAARNATGAMQLAEADLAMRRKQVESYRALQEAGNATNRELARAELEVNQAGARLQSVREEQELRRLEYERVKKQIRQRQLESPIHGVVVAIEKQVGEFVSMTDPVVMQLVQLDALKAVFSVPRRGAQGLKTGQVITLKTGYDSDTFQGVIDFVSPIANPESNTVRVKVRIANRDRKIPSGVTCRWSLSAILDEPPSNAQAGRARSANRVVR